MTGPYKMPEWKKARIKKLTKEGLGIAFIAERVGMRSNLVYQFQVREGLRKVKKRR